MEIIGSALINTSITMIIRKYFIRKALIKKKYLDIFQVFKNYEKNFINTKTKKNIPITMIYFGSYMIYEGFEKLLNLYKIPIIITHSITSGIILWMLRMRGL